MQLFMASKARIALLFSLNLLFFTLVSSHNVDYIYSGQDKYPNPNDYSSSKGVGEKYSSNDHQDDQSPNQFQDNDSPSGGLIDVSASASISLALPDVGSGRDSSNVSPNGKSRGNSNNGSSNGGSSGGNSNGSSNGGNGGNPNGGNGGNSNGSSNSGNGRNSNGSPSGGNGGNSNGNSKNPSTNSGLPAIILPGRCATGGNNQQGQGQGQGRSRCNPLNLGVCANLLNGLVNVEVGDVPTKPCCSLIQGLADLEAALCLCTAIRANVLGLIDLNLPVSLTLLLNNCGRQVSSDYQCSL